MAFIAEMRNVYRFLVENPKGNRRLGRPKLRWEAVIITACVWTRLIRLITGSSEHSYKYSRSVKSKMFYDY